MSKVNDLQGIADQAEKIESSLMALDKYLTGELAGLVKHLAVIVRNMNQTYETKYMGRPLSELSREELVSALERVTQMYLETSRGLE